MVTPGAHPDLLRRVEVVALACSAFCLAMGAITFTGWALDLPLLKSFGPRFAAIKPNAAVGLVLIGASLLLRRGSRAQRESTGMAAVAAAIGVVTLLEYLLGWEGGIDELVFDDHQPPSSTLAPGRMSPGTASMLFVMGTALVLTHARRGHSTRSAGQGLALLASFFALLSLLGYLYDVESFYRVGPFVSVSLPAALAFFAAGAAVLLSNATFGLASLFGSMSGAGAMARRLLPAAILIPALVGWLRLEGQKAELYDTQLGLALFASSNIVCFTALVWWNAKSVQQAEISAQQAAVRLRALADASRAFATVATDYRRLLDSVVATVAELIGDGCQVTLIASDGSTLVNEANAHRDPLLAHDYRAYLASAGKNTLSGNTVSAQVARTGQARFVPVVSPEAVVAQGEEKLRHLVTRLQVHGFIVVPIRVHDRVIGTLSLLRSRPGQPYTQEDGTLLQDLADRAGLAIENARLYQHLEQRVQQRTLELEELNRELEAFGYSVAHDLKAPLRAISGCSSALSEDFAHSLAAPAKRYLELMVDNAERMGRLIDALLSLSRITRAEVRPVSVDLAELSREVAVRLQAAEPERKVTFQIADRLDARGDAQLLTVLLENLLGNSWKFTRPRENAQIEVGRQAAVANATFFVRDNGAGFDMKHVHQLFVPFQRLHGADEFEGTGIGLATVQRIVRRHGGRIWAESAEGKGATFYFTLPGPAVGQAPAHD